MSTVSDQTNQRYEFLIRRAIEFLTEHGGRATKEQIVRHVFGSSASVELWSSLLQSVLANEPSLSLLADGRWALAGYSAPPTVSALGDFTALDVETTGLRPLTHRIIEVAAVRYRNGREVDSWVSFLNPDKALSATIINLTGIRDVDLEDAPRFRDIAGDLLAFLGDDLIVGHNVGFDIAFMSGELKRMARPGLRNDRFDTLAVANRLVPEVRRKSLGKLAMALGIPEGRDHRAYDDAKRTAEVALRLVETAFEKGVRDPVSIRNLGAPMPRQSPDGTRPRRNVLDRSLLTGIPRSPGVYVMFDGYGHVIYVGKARNLRERVGSYFSQAIGYTRKMDGLLESLVSIETHQTGNELEALLLEAQLIRFYQPRYNTALRASENYPYIKINIANPWPRVALTKAVKDDGALYFGPYKSRGTAERVIEVINASLPLRTCTRSFRNARSYGKPCIKLDLGQCIGPCTGQVDRDAYRSLVRSAVAFLEGDPSALLGSLESEINRSIAANNPERTRKLRAGAQLANSVALEQQAISYAIEHHHLLLVQPGSVAGSRDVMLILRGIRWAQVRFDQNDSSYDLAVRLARAFDRFTVHPLVAIDHHSLDDALILNRWIRRQTGHPALLPFEPEDPDLDWHALAERVTRLDPADLELDLSSEFRENDDETKPRPDRDPPPGSNFHDPAELNSDVDDSA